MENSFQQWSALKKEQVVHLLSSSEDGLESTQAKQLLERFGFNELSDHSLSWWEVLQRQFRSLFTVILVVVTVVSIILGEVIDGLMVALFITINVTLSFFQEYRSERSAQLLKKFISVGTHVIRDQKEQYIENRLLVPGDVVIVEAGDIVPADMRILTDTNVLVDESMLTGESLQVSKQENPVIAAESFEATNILFSGTHVISGRAKGVVYATAKSSQIGAIAHLTQQAKRVSGFEESITEYSKVILRVIFVTLLMVIGLNIVIKQQSVDLFSLVFFAVALAISVIPEGLPVVTTLALSQGALMLAKLKVVVKRLSAIEDLGSIEILCTDKTGTLTQNTLSVVDVLPVGVTREELLLQAAMGSSFLGHKRKEPNNSFDIALWKQLEPSAQREAQGIEYMQVVPFDPERKRSTVLCKMNGHYQLITRGVPEILIQHSTIAPAEQKRLLHWAADQGKKGYRVLAIAVTSKVSAQITLKSDEDLASISCIGLIAFADPLKKTVTVAMKNASKLGVQVKILTGDSFEVSTQVGMKVGLIVSEQQVMTGEQFEKLSTIKKHEAVHTHHVFARVSPEQKHAIIHLLQHHANVGFLGEGINDAPALKAANVGIVVRGASDIATQAADVVLLDNDLEVIIEGIKKGREVFSNTVKYIKATLASNFGNFFAVAVASLLSSTLPLLPLQILLLNLLSDFPMISIATDTVDPWELKSPKQYQVYEVVALATLLGVVSSFFDFTYFALFSNKNPSYLQTYWFMGSVLTELVFIYSIRVRKFFLTSIRPGTIMVVLTVFAAITSIVIPFTEFGQQVFGFIRPDFAPISVVLLIAALYFIVSELVKLTYYSFEKKVHQPHWYHKTQ